MYVYVKLYVLPAAPFVLKCNSEKNLYTFKLQMLKMILQNNIHLKKKKK